MTPRSKTRAHEWLELLDRSGLVVTEVPLQRHFPDGPIPVEPRRYQWLVGRWQRFQVDPEDTRRRREWEQFVLLELLGWPSDRERRDSDVPADLRIRPDDLDQTLAPSSVTTDDTGLPILAVWSVPAGQHLDRVEKRSGRWRATPQVKLERWMRASGVRVALLTNGEAFRLVHVPAGLPAGWLEFDAQQWIDDRDTLGGFQLLVGWERIAGTTEPSLAALLSESESEQTDLTDRLGEQVRQAVEDLILAWDRAGHAQGERRLTDIPEEEIYEAAVFVVMRLVFLLFAEERSLLPHGNVFYDEGYGIGRLLHQLQEERRLRPEAFHESVDAWPRLLALFRLVFEGCSHPDLVLPTYGGDLFEPRRTDALRAVEGLRLRIPNPDVYSILRSLTVREVPVGREKLAQRISYRTLDVEHIGYVYEGLLDHRAARARTEPMVKLRNGTEKAYPLTELEDREGTDLIDFLTAEKTLGGDRERIQGALDTLDAVRSEPLNTLSQAVRDRCLPYAGVIQADEVAEPGHLFMTTAASRRATGTHYTPIQYTRAMVQETLDPLVYRGEHGRLDEPLTLRSPRELLDLKICDPAMGSGAFLVQTVRLLGEKLTDAWYQRREELGEDVQLYLPYAEPATDREDRIPLPDEREEAELLARRYVAERCVYGVDKNPLAAEMAKLSVWLVTLSHERPFSFLDHALRVGDSLVGLSHLDQLRTWSLDRAGEQKEVFEDAISDAIDETLELRQELASFPVVEPADVERKSLLLRKADTAVERLQLLADLLVGPWVAAETAQEVEKLVKAGLDTAAAHFENPEALETKARGFLEKLGPFHWPLGFPEVLTCGGFDAVIGNPPYMGGTLITGHLGKPYREYLVRHIAEGRRAGGRVDLVVYFLLRALAMVRQDGGLVGLLCTNTVAEGDSREVGLAAVLGQGAVIYSAHPDEPWPGDASVLTSRVHLSPGAWEGKVRLSGVPVQFINSELKEGKAWEPRPLKQYPRITYEGVKTQGTGFFLTESEARDLIDKDPSNADVVHPFLVGRDVTQHPEHRASRWAICFWDWPLERAEQYPEPFRIVEERVKPDRQRKNDDGTFALRDPLPRKWWVYAERRVPMFRALGQARFFEGIKDTPPANGQVVKAIVCSQVTKFLCFARVDTSQILSQQLVVFPWDSLDLFAFLHSSLHEAWARSRSGSLETRLSYTPRRAVQTFPWPDGAFPPSDGRLREIGRELERLRAQTMTTRSIGLTDLYNLFHDPAEQSAAITTIRALHAEIDERVLMMYGWADVELDHRFRDVLYLSRDDCHRFAISESARVELLRRLSELNRERYEEEVEAGLHEKKRSPKKRKKRKASRHKTSKPKPSSTSESQGALFDYQPQAGGGLKAAERLTPDSLSDPEKAILSWLQSNPGWHGRSDILDGAEVGKGRWRTAINNLLDAGVVRKEGERRGTKYTATGEP